MTAPGRAIVVGGSIGGLFAGAALLKAGWDVNIVERSPVTISGRGAGIVTHPELVTALNTVGADTNGLGVEVTERAAYDLAGARVATLDFRQVVTSWDQVYQVLRALIPDARYQLRRAAKGYSQGDGHVTCHLEGGDNLTGDVLIGADGFRSAIRQQMLPDIRRDYAGYVVWRTLAAEADLPHHIRKDVFQTFGFFLPNGTQIIGYPINGANNDLRPGHRRYNFAWYAKVDTDRLDDMLTDASGEHHPVSIPPPLIRDDVIKEMFAQAHARLPTVFNDILAVSDRPFFTPIYDYHSPTMAQGRVALAGDAACEARPHVGMGVTKAAEDALALATCLEKAPPTAALQLYSQARVGPCRRAYETAQRLGSYIFDSPPGENADGRSNREIDSIMGETAVVPQARSSS